MLNQQFLIKLLTELILVLLLSTLCGIIVEQLFAMLFLGLFGLFVWHIMQLYKLKRWIWQKNTLFPPTSKGSWDSIFYGLHKEKKRMRQRQNELAHIIKRFRYGTASIPDALIVLDSTGKIEWCNKMAPFLVNIQWPRDQGQHIINLIRDPLFANYFQSETFVVPLTLWLNKKTHIEIRIIPYTNSGWIMIIRDIDQLYLAERQRHDFFTNASHELRTPLTVVKSYVDMLIDDQINPSQQQPIFINMQGQIMRMESLITQILTLSKIENSATLSQLITVNMPNILYRIKDNITPIYPDYHFTFDIDNTLTIEGDHMLLDSVVSNLIYNAIKHTPKGTKIHVIWHKVGNQAYFSIYDNGPGIAPHHISRLTERFYQVDDVRTHQDASSGLGLAIVKHALLKHANTKLEIKSTLGKGSQFSFHLPISY